MESLDKGEEFYKKIFDYCMATEWQFTYLFNFAKELGVTISHINDWAVQYINEYLPNEERFRVKQQLKEFAKRNRGIKNLNIKIINPIIYSKMGKITYQLWENEEEQAVVLKYIYDFCEENHYDKDKIEELSDRLGVSKEKIKDYAKTYAMGFLDYTEEEYQSKQAEHREIRFNNRDYKSKKAYRLLLNSNSIEEIVEIVEKSGMNVNALVGGVVDYAIVYGNNDEQLIETLRSKLKIYKNYVAQQKKEHQTRLRIEEEVKERQIKTPIAVSLITEFINDDCDSIEYFCQKKDIDRNAFAEYVEIVKQSHEKLYDLYTHKNEYNKKQRYIEIIRQISYMVDCLKYGIEENETVREFDLIDYFLTTKIPPNDILKISKGTLLEHEYSLLNKFIKQNINGFNYQPGVINQIMQQKVIISYEKDKKGLPIPGTEEIFSNEEKNKIIKFLSNNKIPINLKTYNTAYKRYRSGTLEVEPKSKGQY